MGGVGSRWNETWSENLKKPGGGFGGWMVKTYLQNFHQTVIGSAIKACDIQQDHTVLEVGYGPGIGLKAAFKKIEDGLGTVHGVDFSPEMYRLASNRLKLDDKRKLHVDTGKISLHVCSVTDMPFTDNTFDRVFHVNCHIYWPDMDLAVKELYRVMKPGALMVTTLNRKGLKLVKRLGYVKYGDIDHDIYMDSLKRHGFVNVHMEELDTRGIESLQAIYATKDEVH